LEIHLLNFSSLPIGSLAELLIFISPFFKLQYVLLKGYSRAAEKKFVFSPQVCFAGLYKFIAVKLVKVKKTSTGS
jgi:hypothetical protein